MLVILSEAKNLPVGVLTQVCRTCSPDSLLRRAILRFAQWNIREVGATLVVALADESPQQAGDHKGRPYRKLHVLARCFAQNDTPIIAINLYGSGVSACH